MPERRGVHGGPLARAAGIVQQPVVAAGGAGRVGQWPLPQKQIRHIPIIGFLPQNLNCGRRGASSSSCRCACRLLLLEELKNFRVHC